MPYLLVLIIVPLLTFAAVKYFAGDADPLPTASPTDDAPAPGEDDGSEGTEEDPTVGPDEETEDQTGDEDDAPDPDLDYDTSILVLNGALIAGIAGEVSAVLEADGWTNTSADDYAGNSPAVTSLYYTSADFAAEAQAVADVLGITEVIESASSASNGIVIVIRAEFDVPSLP